MTAPETGTQKRILVLFGLWLVTLILVNFDGGATAALLTYMDKGCVDEATGRVLPGPDGEDYTGYPCLDERDQGLVGTFPYVGLCIGAPLVGYALTATSPKAVLCAGMLGTTVATMMFGYISATVNLFIAKFLIGLTQSTVCIYAPIWVCKYGPKDKATTWIGVTQAMGAVGTMVGYGAASYMSAKGYFYQYVFRIQAFGLAGCTVQFAMLSRSVLDGPVEPLLDEDEGAGKEARRLSDVTSLGGSFRGRSDTETSDATEFVPAPRERPDPFPELGSEHGHMAYMGADLVVGNAGGRRGTLGAVPRRGTRADFSAVPHSRSAQVLEPWTVKDVVTPLFVSTALALCGLFFVVTGIQFWITKYFMSVFKRDTGEVATTFILVSLSGPLLGVGFGATLADRLGGAALQPERCCLMSVVFGVIATVAGWVAAATPSSEQLDRGEVPSHGQYYLVVFAVWILLFFGGGILPPATSLVLQSVPEPAQPFANGLATFMYNVLGYGLGAYLPGEIGQQAIASAGHGVHDADAQLQGTRLGMQVIFLAPITGVLFMGLAWLSSKWSLSFTRPSSSRAGRVAFQDSVEVEMT